MTNKMKVRTRHTQEFKLDKYFGFQASTASFQQYHVELISEYYAFQKRIRLWLQQKDPVYNQELASCSEKGWELMTHCPNK